MPFGAFVQVGDGIEGLVHISEMSAHHVDLPEQVVTPGEELWVKIIDLDLQRRRISLSIKQAAEGGVVAAEYQEHFGEHQYDDEGNYIGPALEHSEEAEAAWAEYYTEDPAGGHRRAARGPEATDAPETAADRPPARSTKPDRHLGTGRAPPIRAKGRAKVPPTLRKVQSREEVGVSSRRTLILIAAVLVGAVAAFALWTYVGGIEDEANDNAERVEIYKIVQDIPKGTFGDEAFAQGLIEQDEIAQEYRPATAITDPVADRRPGGHLRPGGQPGGRHRQFVTQQDSLSTFSQLLEEQRGRHHDLGRPGPGRGRPARAGRLREHPGHRTPPRPRRAPPRARARPEPRSTRQPARYLYQKVQILAVGPDPQARAR